MYGRGELTVGDPGLREWLAAWLAAVSQLADQQPPEGPSPRLTGQTVTLKPPGGLSPVTALLVKANARRQVWRLSDGQQTVYAKRFRRGGWGEGLADWWRGGRAAQREYGLLHRLWTWSAAHRPPNRPVAPEPLGLLSAPSCDWLLTREVPAAIPLSGYLVKNWPGLPVAVAHQTLTELGEALAEVLSALVAAGVTTYDLHPGNFLWRATGLPMILPGVSDAEPARWPSAVGPWQAPQLEPPHQAPQLIVLDLEKASAGFGWWQTLVWGRGAGAGPEGVVRALVWLNHALRPRFTKTQRLRIWRGFARAAPQWGLRPHLPDVDTVDGQHPPPERATLMAIEARTDAFDKGFHRRRDKRPHRDGKYFAAWSAAEACGGLWRGTVLLRQPRHGDLGAAAPAWDFDPALWQAVLAQPTALMAAGAARAVLKDSPSVRVQTVALAGLRPDGQPLVVVCKIPRAKTWGRWLANWLRPGRVWRAWSMGHALLQRGLPTPVPLVVGQCHRWWGLWPAESFVLTEWIADGQDLDVYLAGLARQTDTAQAIAQMRAVIPPLARLLANLHRQGFVHRDLKAANLLVRPGGPRLRDQPPSAHLGIALPEVLLIDMDGLWRRESGTLATDRHRALARLAASTAACPLVSATERVRFMRVYLDSLEQPRGAWRDLWRQVAPLAVAKWPNNGSTRPPW